MGGEENARKRNAKVYIRRGGKQLQYFFPISEERLSMPGRMCLMKRTTMIIMKTSNTHRRRMCRTVP